MKVSDCMTRNVLSVSAQEPVSVAAQAHVAGKRRHAAGARGNAGSLCGVVTDRDLTLRCAAAGRDPGTVAVREVMTGRVVTAAPEMETWPGPPRSWRSEQVRRLPVVESRQASSASSASATSLRRQEYTVEAASCLEGICEGTFTRMD
jgi:CBS domain-containing protein